MAEQQTDQSPRNSSAPSSRENYTGLGDVGQLTRQMLMQAIRHLPEAERERIKRESSLFQQESRKIEDPQKLVDATATLARQLGTFEGLDPSSVLKSWAGSLMPRWPTLSKPNEPGESA